MEPNDMDSVTEQQRSMIMSKVKSKNTSIEITVRRILHSMGYRYRLHDHSLPGTPDIVFSRRRLAIFVNGCFWHGHAGCKRASLPETRRDFWLRKVEKTKVRDNKNIENLDAMGWTTLTIWQCEIKNHDVLANKLNELINQLEC